MRFSALLRSIEGEELAEYSKRAYNVYRAQGVIQDGAELNDYPASEPTANDLSMSARQLRCLPAPPPPASQANILHEASRSKTFPADDVDQHGGGRKECGPVGVGARDAVMPFSPPPSSPQFLRPEVGEEHSLNRSGKNSAEPPAPRSGHELRVIDFSEVEDVDVVAHKPDKPASSPSEKFRSRLRAPRAGRALALASANVCDKRGSRQKETSLGFRRDVSGKELLPPPPPSSGTTTVPPRRKEAWTKEREEAGHEPEMAYSTGLVGAALEVSDEDADGIVAHSSGAFTKKAMEYSEGSRGKQGSACEGRNSTQDMEEQTSVAVGIGGGRGSGSEHSFGEEHANDAEISKGWPMDRSGCSPTTSPAPSVSPRLKGTTPRTTTGGCRRRCDKTESHAPRLQGVSASNASLPTLLVATLPLNTRVQGLHRSRNGDHGDVDEVSTGREGTGDPRKAPDNEEFVWFGQPDTPSGCQPEKDFRNTREARVGDGDEGGSPAAAAAPPGEGAAPPGEGAARATVDLAFGPLNSYRHQQQQAKAQLLLQMEVRRQRAIIEKAFRAREEGRRVRRARIGAEVFKRIQDLRRRRSPSPSTTPIAPPTSGPKQPSSPAKQESSITDDQEREPQEAMHRVQDAAAASPPRAEKAVKAWGFRPALAENTTKAVQPERLVPGATPSEGVVSVGQVPPVETLAPAPPIEFAHRGAAPAENPWRRVVSRQKQPELESPSPAKREPTPPPVSFNVEANAVGDGAERPGGGVSLEQEKARRQERYEALRARKMAEAEVRFLSLRAGRTNVD